jgi:hypothetical protein
VEELCFSINKGLLQTSPVGDDVNKIMIKIMFGMFRDRYITQLIHNNRKVRCVYKI